MKKTVFAILLLAFSLPGFTQDKKPNYSETIEYINNKIKETRGFEFEYINGLNKISKDIIINEVFGNQWFETEFSGSSPAENVELVVSNKNLNLRTYWRKQNYFNPKFIIKIEDESTYLKSSPVGFVKIKFSDKNVKYYTYTEYPLAPHLNGSDRSEGSTNEIFVPYLRTGDTDIITKLKNAFFHLQDLCKQNEPKDPFVN